MVEPDSSNSASHESGQSALVTPSDDDIRDFFVRALERIGASREMLAAAHDAIRTEEASKDGSGEPEQVERP